MLWSQLWHARVRRQDSETEGRSAEAGSRRRRGKGYVDGSIAARSFGDDIGEHLKVCEDRQRKGQAEMGESAPAKAMLG